MKLTKLEYAPVALHIVAIPEPGETVPAITATSVQTLKIVDGSGYPITITVDSVVPVIASVTGV